MCGLFGAIRVVGPAHAATVANVVLALGVLSEERGTDSAGLAMIAADTLRREAHEPGAEKVRAQTAGLDGTFIVKGPGRFRDLPLAAFREVMESLSTAFMGHTRWATQGATTDLANASPMYAGSLIGTHNGDVSTGSIPAHGTLAREAIGETDSEILFRALDRTRTDRRALTKVLRRVEGRAALAIFDRTRPDRIYLARTAVAPLSYAYDQHGNFYYASNPDWFRKIARDLPDVEFTEIVLIPEGHLLTVSTLTGEIEDTRRFTPTARERDIRMMNIVAYRGFTSEDKQIDLTLHRHRIVHSPLQTWPVPTQVEPAAPKRDTSSTKSSAPKATSTERVTGSRLNERLDAEQPEVWDAVADSYDSEVMDRYSRIDWDEIEGLCITGDRFDNDKFMNILTAPEDLALDLIDELRQDSRGLSLRNAV